MVIEVFTGQENFTVINDHILGMIIAVFRVVLPLRFHLIDRNTCPVQLPHDAVFFSRDAPYRPTLKEDSDFCTYLLRLLQGFALGGEIGSSTAFLAEAAPPGRRGRWIALQYLGQGLAVLAADTATAEVFATAAMMCRPDEALALLDAAGLAGFLVSADGTQHRSANLEAFVP